MKTLSKFSRYLETFAPVIVIIGLIVSGLLTLLHLETFARQLLIAILLIGSFPFLKNMFISFCKKEFGVDLIAVVSIVSSVLIGEYVAGAVILLMLSGGEFLEAYALKRARRDLTLLLANAPSVAHIKDGEKILDVKAEEVKVNDTIVIKPGEIIPVDGIVMNGESQVDESTLTGEALPVDKAPHHMVMSGTTNVSSALEVRALRASKESKYQQIIKLVRDAESHKAPFVRLADRYSVWFTICAFTLAAIGWFVSKDPARALAVLVVATPCPLILATPIAFASGISRAAKRGVIVKRGAAIEKLAAACSFLFDKTGTLTLGVPRVHTIHSYNHHSEEDVLCLAASVDQLSVHILARSLVTYAKSHNLSLSYPEHFQEDLGNGVSAVIHGKTVLLGKLRYVEEKGIPVDEEIRSEYKKLKEEGRTAVYLTEEKKLVGVVAFQDEIRPNVKNIFHELAKDIKRIVMVTGDKKVVAERIAAEIGIHDIRAEALPEDKLTIVKELQRECPPVVMVGDGINDAPALATADVGISLSAHGSSAVSEAGDIVITVDDLSRVVEAKKISMHVMHIAKQCIFIGIGLSILLMVVAMLGHLKPLYGALLQELVDVVVIFNALRVYQQKIAT